MAQYVSTLRFEDHVRENKDRMDSLEQTQKDMMKELGKKVSWSVLWSIVSLLVAYVGGVTGLLYKEVKETRDEVKTIQATSNSTKSDVSYIRGVLDRAEVTQ